MSDKQRKKIFIERPSSIEYVMQVVRYGLFSVTFYRELFHLFAYYAVNHIKGINRAHIGPRTRIRPTVLFRDAERIHLGKGCTINHNNILWAGKQDAVIRMGDNVITGPDVKVFAFAHGTDVGDIPMIDQHFTEEDVIIGDDVWIGAGSIILPGAKIGKGVVVAAGSVVTKELPPYTICAGVPAKVIKQRT